MIEHPAPQNSPDWDRAHLGIVTSRCAARLVTPKWRVCQAATVDKLLAQLVAEWVTGQPWSEWGGNAYTERGERLEPEALAYYDLMRGGVLTRSSGLIYRDENRLVGTSPDRIAVDDTTRDGITVSREVGVIESKSPGAPGHIANVLSCLDGRCPPEHLHQCQWHMWITGADWCDLLSYSDEIAVQGLVRVFPLQEAQDAFDVAVPLFEERLIHARERLTDRGLGP